MSQYVVMKSTHFAAWMMHFFLTVLGGAFTGGLIGFLVQCVLGDSGEIDFGVCALVGIGIYCVCFLAYVFVMTALGYEDL